MANNKTYTCSPSEVCLSDSDKKGTDVMKDKVSQKNVCEEEVPLNNNIGKQISDFVDMPSEAVEQGMDANVSDEIDGAKGEQVPNHVVKKDTYKSETPSWPDGATIKLSTSSPSPLSYHPSDGT
ncbi:hypothetical protein Tco_0425299 [Tanacetum coccineum]